MGRYGEICLCHARDQLEALVAEGVCAVAPGAEEARCGGIALSDGAWAWLAEVGKHDQVRSLQTPSEPRQGEGRGEGRGEGGGRGRACRRDDDVEDEHEPVLAALPLV